MNTKLILVEGIPGSGKTTIAGKVYEWYRAKGIPANLFLEGDAHPADLGWNACIPVAEYREILKKYPELGEEIEMNTSMEEDYAIVAYTQVKTDDEAFSRHMERFEVYDGRVPDDVFFGLHDRRWRAFGAEAETLTVFESAFLQNHVNELLFWRDADEAEIIAHHNRLLSAVSRLSPVLIYLSQPDIRETIRRVAEERVSKEGKRWIDHVISYCENSSFGKRNDIKGYDGAIEFFAIRKRLEMKILGQISIPYAVIENREYDWSEVWNDVKAHLARMTGL